MSRSAEGPSFGKRLLTVSAARVVYLYHKNKVTKMRIKMESMQIDGEENRSKWPLAISGRGRRTTSSSLQPLAPDEFPVAARNS